MTTLLLLVVTPLGCSFPSQWGFGGPHIPEYTPPSDEDIQQLTNRMMGKAPRRETPVTTDGVEVVFQTGHAGGIHALALSPNGRYIASSGSQDHSVKIWDVASGQEVRNFTGSGSMALGVDALAFSEDSALVITHEYGGPIKVFEVASGREVRSVGSPLAGGAEMSANGRFAAANDRGAVGSAGRRALDGQPPLSLIDLATGKIIWTLPDSEAQRPVAISRDGKTLVTSRTDTGAPSPKGMIGTIGSSIGSMFGLDDLLSSG
jgi:WD40 repeat protein